MSKKEAIFLDFDGVIVDSILECFMVSKKMFLQIVKSEFKEEQYKNLFYEYRRLVKPSYQYMLLNKAIEKRLFSSSINVEQEFFLLDRNITVSEKNKFASVFLEIRRFYQKDIRTWLSMHELTNFGKTLVNKELKNHFIITTKDRHSVELLLNHFNILITNIFDEDCFLSSGSKGRILSSILDNSCFDSAIFIDDSYEHLDSVDDKRIKCLFADWGYGNNTNYDICRGY